MICSPVSWVRVRGARTSSAGLNGISRLRTAERSTPGCPRRAANLQDGGAPSRRPPGGLPHGHSWAEPGKVGCGDGEGCPQVTARSGCARSTGWHPQAWGRGSDPRCNPRNQRQKSTTDAPGRHHPGPGSRSVRPTTADEHNRRTKWILFRRVTGSRPVRGSFFQLRGLSGPRSGVGPPASRSLARHVLATSISSPRDVASLSGRPVKYRAFIVAESMCSVSAKPASRVVCWIRSGV
jgi:hypothetical protein